MTSAEQTILGMMDSGTLSPSEIQSQLGDDWSAQRLNKYLAKLKKSHRILAMHKDQQDIGEYRALGLEFPERKETLYTGTPAAHHVYEYLIARAKEVQVKAYQPALIKLIEEVSTDIARHEAQYFIYSQKRTTDTKQLRKKVMGKAVEQMYRGAYLEGIKKMIMKYNKEYDREPEKAASIAARDIATRHAIVVYNAIVDHLVALIHFHTYKDEDDSSSRADTETKLYTILLRLEYYHQIDDVHRYFKVDPS